MAASQSKQAAIVGRVRWLMDSQAGAIRPRAPQQALMDDMMETQGVDLLAAVRAGDGFVRARANCRDCTHEPVCRAWFLEPSGKPADFCPNGEFFASLKTEEN
jgi:hypothetical protein